MSLSAELAREVRNSSGCPVCNWLSRQTKQDQEAFAQWVEAGHPGAPLLRACKRKGLHAGKENFYLHLNEKHQ